MFGQNYEFYQQEKKIPLIVTITVANEKNAGTNNNVYIQFEGTSSRISLDNSFTIDFKKGSTNTFKILDLTPSIANGKFWLTLEKSVYTFYGDDDLIFTRIDIKSDNDGGKLVNRTYTGNFILNAKNNTLSFPAAPVIIQPLPLTRPPLPPLPPTRQPLPPPPQKPVDCQVTWSPWSACDKDGNRSRTRTITTEPKNGGATCPPFVQSQQCPPVNCKVDDVWGSWSACSQPCGGGTQYATRIPTQQSLYGGATCPPLSRSQVCNTQNCPVNCREGVWGTWSSCDKPCGGGTQYSTRIPIQAQYGGTPCPTDLYTQTQRPCNTQNCPVNCQMGDWGTWSACDKDCGGGYQYSTRIPQQEAQYGGTPCPTDLSTQRPCNTQNCTPVDSCFDCTQPGCGCQTGEVCYNESGRVYCVNIDKIGMINCGDYAVRYDEVRGEVRGDEVRGDDLCQSYFKNSYCDFQNIGANGRENPICKKSESECVQFTNEGCSGNQVCTYTRPDSQFTPYTCSDTFCSRDADCIKRGGPNNKCAIYGEQSQLYTCVSNYCESDQQCGIGSCVNYRCADSCIKTNAPLAINENFSIPMQTSTTAYLYVPKEMFETNSLYHTYGNRDQYIYYNYGFWGFIQISGDQIFADETIRDPSNSTSTQLYQYVNTSTGKSFTTPDKSGYVDNYKKHTFAKFKQPQGLAFCKTKNSEDKYRRPVIFVSDTGNNCIRMISTTISITTTEFVPIPIINKPGSVNNVATQIGVFTLTGSPDKYVGIDGSLTEASFNGPTGLDFDSNGFLYVADTGNNKLRKISIDQADIIEPSNLTGTVSTLVELNEPRAVLFNSGMLYVSDATTIRKINVLGNNQVTIIASGLNKPYGLVFSGTKLLFSDATGVNILDEEKQIRPVPKTIFNNKPLALMNYKDHIVVGLEGATAVQIPVSCIN